MTVQKKVRVLIIGTGAPIHDTQCGFKLFTAEAAERMFLNLHVRRWAFDLELVLLAQKLSYKIKTKSLLKPTQEL